MTEEKFNNEEGILFNGFETSPNVEPQNDVIDHVMEQIDSVQTEPQMEVNPEPQVTAEPVFEINRPVVEEAVVEKKDVSTAVANGDKVIPEVASINADKLMMIKKMADNLQRMSKELSDLISIHVVNKDVQPITVAQVNEPVVDSLVNSSNVDSNNHGKVVEGPFNGEKMIGADGQQYDVPVNYASKSKLVEGDVLKLIITDRGSFIYKQIRPVERLRIVGVLGQGPTGEYYATVNDRRWRILGASVTYFRGQLGDEIIMLIPRESSSRWAAVENIINKG